jgi:hypothetical protein
MNSLLCTIIVWGGMYYATPKWMNEQIPEWMWGRYEIFIAPYGTPLNKIKTDIDPKTTALIGFSAGGIDVLNNYKKDYAFVGLIDPSTRDRHAFVEYGPNTFMIYDISNWGDINKNLDNVAAQVIKTGGKAVELNMNHRDMPKYFFETHFRK